MSTGTFEWSVLLGISRVLRVVHEPCITTGRLKGSVRGGWHRWNQSNHVHSPCYNFELNEASGMSPVSDQYRSGVAQYAPSLVIV